MNTKPETGPTSFADLQQCVEANVQLAAETRAIQQQLVDVYRVSSPPAVPSLYGDAFRDYANLSYAAAELRAALAVAQGKKPSTVK